MKRILVVEDNLENRNLLLEALESEGFHPLSAVNGQVGVKQAKEHLPDLVLCDIIMSGLDGYGVLSNLREDPATAVIPFIFLTAKGNKAELRRGMELGADDYLTKPLIIEELLKAIATQFQKRENLKRWLVQFSSVSESESAATKIEKNNSFFPNCPQLKAVFDFIDSNYHLSISLAEVAQAVGYSPAYLTDLVRRQTGYPVNNWIIKRRMAAACSLLTETNQSVEQIAETIGYQNYGHFFRQFRQHYGTTPQVWRKAEQARIIPTQTLI